MAVIFKKKSQEMIVNPLPVSEDGVFHMKHPSWLHRTVSIPAGYTLPTRGIQVKIDWVRNGMDVFPDTHWITPQEYEEAPEVRENGIMVRRIPCHDWIR